MKYDLEHRLVKFAVLIIEVCDLLPNSKAGNALEFQLSKSGISSALNYGEAQAAESKADFIHKMRVCLKELRETWVSLRIIKEKPLIKDPALEQALVECSQLVAIFTVSIRTAKTKKY